MRMVRPRSVPAGDGLLPAGVRASPGTVGYLGADAALTVYTSAGAAPPGCVWNFQQPPGPAYLTTTTNDVWIDHAKIFGELLLLHQNLTVTNSKVITDSGALYSIHGDIGSTGTMIVRDNTIQRLNAAAGDVNSAVTSIGPSLQLVRCEILGTGDALQPNIMGGNTILISQCYVHDLAKVDAEQHLDPVQPFQGETSAATSAVTIEHNWLDAIGSGSTAIVTPNSAVTLGQNSSNGFEKYNPVLINNNYLAGGVLHLRIYQNTGNVRVTNNRFGPIVDVGTHVVENPGGVIEWTGNTDSNGNPVNM